MTADDPRLKAARIGSVVALTDIRTVSVEATLHRLVYGRLFVELLPPEISWDRSEDTVLYELQAAVVISTTSAEASDHSEGDNKNAQPTAPVFTATVRFLVNYELSEGADFSEDEYKAFGDVSVTFSAFPYIRELLNSLTVRAGLPPLVLGTLRSPLPLAIET